VEACSRCDPGTTVKAQGLRACFTLLFSCIMSLCSNASVDLHTDRWRLEERMVELSIVVLQFQGAVTLVLLNKN
jgi:hypothetical protein